VNLNFSAIFAVLQNSSRDSSGGLHRELQQKVRFNKYDCLRLSSPSFCPKPTLRPIAASVSTESCFSMAFFALARQACYTPMTLMR
jgi:hypothetical protein